MRHDTALVNSMLSIMSQELPFIEALLNKSFYGGHSQEREKLLICTDIQNYYRNARSLAGSLQNAVTLNLL